MPQIVTGKTEYKINKIRNAAGRIVVGRKGVISFINGVVIHTDGPITYTTDINTQTTTFEYVPPRTSPNRSLLYADDRTLTPQKETSDVNIQRTNFSIFEKMVKLSEVESVNDFNDFANGFI